MLIFIFSLKDRLYVELIINITDSHHHFCCFCLQILEE